jgi:tetratricopeptide (TPR) repeat protein
MNMHAIPDHPICHVRNVAKRDRFVRLLAATILLCSAVPVFAQASATACGSLENAFGPYDYRVDRGQPLRLVDSAHFTPAVEALVRGNTGSLGGDLNYTLRAFPNHHRALMSVMRYGEKMKSPQPSDLLYPVECYFERALRFRPEDVIVRMIYATFLQKAGRDKEADVQLQDASRLAEDDAFTHYNVGLIYLDGKNYGGALREAHKAYALGFPRPELKNRLVAAGKWHEPTATVPEEPGSAPQGAPASSSPQ